MHILVYVLRQNMNAGYDVALAILLLIVQCTDVVMQRMRKHHCGLQM